MREVHASKSGVLALNSRRIFSKFGGEVVAYEEKVGGEGQVPGSPVAGVDGVIGLTDLLITSRRKRTREHVGLISKNSVNFSRNCVIVTYW